MTSFPTQQKMKIWTTITMRYKTEPAKSATSFNWFTNKKQVMQMIIVDATICAKIGPLKTSWISAQNLKIKQII